jgi:hypothetical protein
MNLTVGPLPPAVYWRRRALVAGVLVLLILVVAYSCGGSSGSGAPGQRSGAKTPTTGSPGPTTSTLRPQTAAPPSSDAVSPSTSNAAAAGPGPVAGPADPSIETCTDAELQLTPSVQRITRGTFAYELTLKIRNTSTRNCKRDIGSTPQELHVTQNGPTLWSSDSCPAAQGQSNVATLGAGIEYAYQIGWDGTSGTTCTGGHPLPAGTYQIVAKLDTKVSAPAAFTITGK